MSEKKKPYFSDVVLYKRVDKYLEDNIDKQMIDKDAMVDELRNTYKEYQRRNRSAFRVAVFKAYHMINQNVIEVTQERSNDGSDVEALDDQASPEIRSPENTGQSTGPTAAAQQMMMTYLQGLNSMSSPVGVRFSKTPNNEAINISSDEGEGEPQPKRSAPTPSFHRVQPVNTPKYHHNLPPIESIAHGQGRLPTAIHHEHNSAHHYNHQVPRNEDKRRKKPSKNEGSSSRQRPSVSIFPIQKRGPSQPLPDTIPDLSFADFGGYPKVLQAINDLILHFYQSDIYSLLGVTPPRGFILHGPPGCGKTLLAHAVAGELHLPLVKVSGPELIGGISGESEERIRKVFLQAKQQVPCILFIDEIDVISQTRENARKDMERRIVSQLIVSLDDLSSCDEGEELIVIGATNRVEELDPGLRRAGRFDKEVCIGIPDRSAREGILKVLCRCLKMSGDISIAKIAELTPGFVAADLKSLISDAAVAAVKRFFVNNAKFNKSDVAIALAKRCSLGDAMYDKTLSIKRAATISNEEPIQVADDEKIDDVRSEAKSNTVEKDSEDKPKQDKNVEQSVADSAVEKESSTSDTKDDDVGEPDSSDSKAEEKPEKSSEVMDVNDEPDSSDAKTAEKPQGSSEVMDVDDTSSSNDKVLAVPDDEIPSARETIVENGTSEEDKKSEDMDACVIIDDGKSDKEEPVAQGKSRFNVQIEMEDLLSALKTTQPSAKREGFATVPDVTWDDIGSLKDVRNELTMSIMMPVKYPDEFTRMGIDAPSGIMLWGPPGCGKTLLAKAIANEANINFISVKGPELLNMYVGESEKAVRTCFQRARNSQPCVIFFDEIDALCPRRSDSSEGSVSSRVVNQVLTEMDGVEGRKGVFLMAASNRPDMVDPAILRPGRLDKIVKVGLPSAQDRIDILRAITKNGTKPPLDGTVSLERIANSPECEGYSGADLAALVKEASILALTNHLSLREEATLSKDDVSTLCVSEGNFEDALKKIKPSVHTEERRRYERLEKTFAAMDR
ncbi:hypothetical protein GE061_005652 [Apolygus lucorum]|uniref:AAA+ ATPase domain-containing protein n=1 Tax=Apolygus lucorum TaxID=248454 RepID=A0A8S9X0U7_APOLU|nr:hypothetical protein GE061_005652 [Apolygus lucorum]